MFKTVIRSMVGVLISLSLSCFFTSQAWAASAEDKPVNTSALITFFLFVAVTLVISYWAGKYTTTNSAFYTAGGQISAGQNGTAIAGDFMSAASFLGISGLIFTVGFDALILAVGALAGWPIMLFLMSERIRNLGKYTFTDVVSYRLKKRPIRIVGTIGSISVIIFYLIAQMVGAGKLIELLLGVPYEFSLVIVGVLVISYVTVGGMLATTWVQIIKAVLLLLGAALVCVLALLVFNFDVDALFSEAVISHSQGDQILQPGSFFTNRVQVVTLGVSMMFGTLGLPHILMRLFTVADMQAAKKSVFYASGLMGLFYLMTIFIGFAGIVFVNANPDYFVDGQVMGGSNMVAIHLSHALGGNILMGFMSAVAFSTILAVVAGLTVAGSAAIAHDIYSEHLCNGKGDPKKELFISRITVVVLCVMSVLLGFVFKDQNVAFIAVIPMVISASVNFPILILAMYWRRFSTRGAVVGGIVGFVLSLLLIVAGPMVWVKIIGAEKPLFAYDYPALFTMSAAFTVMVLVSIFDKSKTAQQDRDAFDRQLLTAELAIDKCGDDNI